MLFSKKINKYFFIGILEYLKSRSYYCLRRWLRTLSIEACAMALKTRTAGTRHPRPTNGVTR